MFEVDKDDYPAYLAIIPFEMNISMIQQRLNNMYYRHIQVNIPSLHTLPNPKGYYGRYAAN